MTLACYGALEIVGVIIIIIISAKQRQNLYDLLVVACVSHVCLVRADCFEDNPISC